MTGSIQIKKATLADLSILFTLCRQTYSENFADHWEGDGLKDYLDLVYGRERMRIELLHPDVHYFIAFVDEEPVGFLKLNTDSRGSDNAFPSSAEVEKLYFKVSCQRKGLGKKLMDEAFDVARNMDKKILWLGVLDTNLSAIDFYRKLGFELHDKTKVHFPHFKEERRGMWRMTLLLRDN